MSVRNVTVRNKKALDLFDPDTMDRIRKLKSRKKNSKRDGGFSDSQVENMYNLSTRVQSKKSSPKNNLCLIKKIDKTSPNSHPYQSHHVANSDNNLYRNPVQNNIHNHNPLNHNPLNHNPLNHNPLNQVKPEIEFKRVDQNYQLPISYGHHSQIKKPIQPLNNIHPKIQTHPHKYKNTTSKKGIQQIGGIARRKHSPKTVWRLVRRQQKKHVSPKSTNEKKQHIKHKFQKHNKHRQSKFPKKLKFIDTPQKSIDKKKTTQINKKSQNKQIKKKINNHNISKVVEESNKKLTKSKVLILDKKGDVQKRYRQRKTLRSRVKRWNRGKILFYLARRGVVSLDTKAPQSLLTDLYLSCRAMGNIYIEHD